MDPPNVQVSRFGPLISGFGPAKTCRFGPPKRAGFQVWTPQTCRFAGLQVWTPQTCRFPGLDPPKRAGFQIWTPQKLRFSGLDPQNMQVSRFKRACRFPGLDPLNVQVSRFGPPKTTFGGPNLEACTFWEESARFGGVQTWKPARFGGSKLQTCKPARLGGSPARFGRSKPGNLHVSRDPVSKGSRTGCGVYTTQQRQLTLQDTKR